MTFQEKASLVALGTLSVLVLLIFLDERKRLGEGGWVKSRMSRAARRLATLGCGRTSRGASGRTDCRTTGTGTRTATSGWLLWSRRRGN